MEIQKAEDVPVKKQRDGDERHYHIFEEFEIIEFSIAPGVEQSWHRHNEIWEAVLVTEGEMIAKEGNTEVAISEGDVVKIEPNKEHHTLENRSKEPAFGIAFKLHPSEKSTHELFSKDKESRDELQP